MMDARHVLRALGDFFENKVRNCVVFVNAVQMLLYFDGGDNRPAVAAAVENVVLLRSFIECHVAVQHISRLQQQSHVTRHTSHITRHTSHVTHHTSHVTRHTSHVTRHTSLQPQTHAAARAIATLTVCARLFSLCVGCH